MKRVKISVGETPSKRRNSNVLSAASPQLSVFEDLVQKSGIELHNDSPNCLTVDSVKWRRNMERNLKSHPNYPLIMRELLLGLNQWLGDPKAFLWAMRESQGTDMEMALDRQNSLLHLLLKVPVLHSKIMELLLDKLLEAAHMDDPELEGVDVPLLILSQFRWLHTDISESLCEKILELLQATPVHIQRDIIALIPDILPEHRYEKILPTLGELLKSSPELRPAILEALPNLTTENKVLRAQALKVLPSAPNAHLPVYFQFLLKDLPDMQSALEVMESLRNRVDLSSSEDQQGVLLALDSLRVSLSLNKVIGDALLKAISRGDEAKEMDVLSLLLLHSLPTRKKSALSLLKKKVISSPVQWGIVVENLIKQFPLVMESLFKEYLSMAESLLTRPEPRLHSFASQMFRHAFVCTKGRYTKQEVVVTLVALLTRGGSTGTQAALSSLHSIASEDPSSLSLYYVFLLTLLDHPESMSPGQLGGVWDILVLLAMAERRNENLRGKLATVLTKFISSRDLKFKKYGIIGLAMMIKNINVEVISKWEVDVDAWKREALKLLQVGFDKTEGHYALRGLLLDLLSSVFSSGKVIVDIEKEVQKRVEHEFWELFVSEAEDEHCMRRSGMLVEGVDMELRYTLVSHPEHSPWVLQPLSQHQWQLLCPCFRLLATMVRIQKFGDKRDLKRLLWTQLCLPSHDLQDRIREEGEASVQLLIIGLYVALNWFIEIINMFAPDRSVQNEVLERLQQIVTLKAEIEEAENLTDISISPPQFSFDLHHDSAKEDTKRAFRKAKKMPEKALSFRSIDFCVFHLLRGSKLNVPEKIYLLKDLEGKLKLAMGPNGEEVPNGDLKNAPLEMGKLIPSLWSLLVESLPKPKPSRNEDDSNEEVEQDGVIAQEKELVELIIECLVLFFSWPWLHSSPCYESLLHNSLRAMGEKVEGGSQRELLVGAFGSLESLLNTETLNSSNVSILRLMLLLSDIAGALDHNETADQMKGLLSESSLNLLKEEKGKGLTLKNLRTLLHIYLRNSADMLKSVQALCQSTILHLCSSIDSDAESDKEEMFPAINKKNLWVVYEEVCSALVEGMQRVKKKEDGISMEDWTEVSDIFLILVNALKTFSSPAFIKAALASGTWLIKEFLSSALPQMEVSFKIDKDNVLGLLKKFQSSTRYLQHVCTHSKRTQNLALANKVPALKKLLEEFVFRVKGMLAMHGCLDAFWMGNLKNRDLQGQELLSQHESGGEEDEDDNKEGREREVDGRDEEDEGEAEQEGEGSGGGDDDEEEKEDDDDDDEPTNVGRKRSRVVDDDDDDDASTVEIQRSGKVDPGDDLPIVESMNTESDDELFPD